MRRHAGAKRPASVTAGLCLLAGALTTGADQARAASAGVQVRIVVPEICEARFRGAGRELAVLCFNRAGFVMTARNLDPTRTLTIDFGAGGVSLAPGETKPVLQSGGPARHVVPVRLTASGGSGGRAAAPSDLSLALTPR